DFIIVHESANEWRGNNLTMKEQAAMWVHESYANYAESLYEECLDGKAAGARYVIGVRDNVRNDRPIVAPYGVNAEGSGDMYYKGGNMLHTIRQVVNDDAKWREILRGLQKTFWHQTVTGAQVEDYISRQAGVDLSPVFEEYLNTTMIPVLEYKFDGRTVSYRWADVVPGFAIPVKVTLAPERYTFIHPTAHWQTASTTLASPAEFKVDENFYVTVKNVGPGGE
ncbi:MAG: peptidase M1, partial [Gemmatimonadetes bacterium 21-71-4]